MGSVPRWPGDVHGNGFKVGGRGINLDCGHPLVYVFIALFVLNLRISNGFIPLQFLFYQCGGLCNMAGLAVSLNGVNLHDGNGQQPHTEYQQGDQCFNQGKAVTAICCRSIF